MDKQNNLNAMLIDQQVIGIVNTHKSFFPEERWNEPDWMKSAAFVVLTVKCILDVDLETAAECLTDGGKDFAVDAIHIGEVDDGEFEVTIFQGKYSRDMYGDRAFPTNSLQQIVQAVKILFDPLKPVVLNEKLAPVIEEVRSRVKDGLIPSIRVVLCNNGLKWDANGQEVIETAGLPANQVEFIHFNHEKIIEVLRRTKTIDATLQLKGLATIETFSFKRVLIGRIPVVNIAEIFEKFDIQLLERNVRRYLGLHSNRVNSEISSTLVDPEKRGDFYFFNNGITIVCRKLSYNGLQSSDYAVNVEGMQVINGGQTCKTIQLTLREHPELRTQLTNVDVLVRIYELQSDSEDFVRAITYATNSQNPVDLRDLHANDSLQKNLEIGLSGLGFEYRHKRDDTEGGVGGNILYSSITAEAVLSIWRKQPHQAKFMRKELFGKLYLKAFDGLNAAQAVVANQIFRFVENERKRPQILNCDFLPYSAHYVAMRMGILLLKAVNMSINDITHRTYAEISRKFEEVKVNLYKTAVGDVEDALSKLYNDRAHLSLQQLSATFRRGDLIDALMK